MSKNKSASKEIVDKHKQEPAEYTVLSASPNQQLEVASRNNLGMLTSDDKLNDARFHPHDLNAKINPIVKLFSKVGFKKTNKVEPSTALMRLRSED